MTRFELIAICERLDACGPAFSWLRSLSCETAAECWDACERADWMVWLLTARPDIVPNRALRLIAVDCARDVQPIADAWFAAHAPQHVGAGVRLLDLVESAPDADPQMWAAASDAAWDAAWAAANDAAWAATSDAAWDAAWAAASDAAWAAARAAVYDAARAAAWATEPAAPAAEAAARAAVYDAALADQARMVRARVAWADVECGLRERQLEDLKAQVTSLTKQRDNLRASVRRAEKRSTR